MEQFPTSYLRLTHRLLSVLRDILSKDQFAKLFARIGAEIVDKYDFNPENKTPDERLNKLKQILTTEGFIVEWKKTENAFRLTMLSCPYFQIGAEHPEVCNLDHAVISAFFAEPVQIKSCIFDGDNRCTYEIQTNQEPKKEANYE